MRVTVEALEVIARAVTERDVQIAALQQQVSDLREQVGGGWPAEDGATEQATADLDDTVPPAYPESSDYPEYLEYPEYTVYHEPAEYQNELDDPLTPAGPEPEATAEPGETEPEVTEPAVAEPGVAEDASEPDAAPAQEPASEPARPGEAAPHVPGSGSGPVPPVAITRPQPIYRHPAGDDDQGDRGAADAAGEQPAGPSGLSAPWGPAQPPGEPAPEAPATAETPSAPATPVAPDDHGWGTDPADTSPDAKPLDWAATAPSAAAEPAQPPAAEAEASDWDGGSQPSPAPSVWDVASRQVDQDQARPAPSPAAPRAAFIWDEDPHQTVVWGAEHARAKAARTADETLPTAEQRDERG
jgi:hypothetical protein